MVNVNLLMLIGLGVYATVVTEAPQAHCTGERLDGVDEEARVLAAVCGADMDAVSTFTYD